MAFTLTYDWSGLEVLVHAFNPSAQLTLSVSQRGHLGQNRVSKKIFFSKIKTNNSLLMAGACRKTHPPRVRIPLVSRLILGATIFSQWNAPGRMDPQIMAVSTQPLRTCIAWVKQESSFLCWGDEVSSSSSSFACHRQTDRQVDLWLNTRKEIG